MRLRLVVVLALLGVWLLWGSVAVAFEHCAMMGPLCEAPCGLGILGLPTVMPSLPQLVPMTVVPPLNQSTPDASPTRPDHVPRVFPA